MRSDRSDRNEQVAGRHNQPLLSWRNKEHEILKASCEIVQHLMQSIGNQTHL